MIKRLELFVQVSRQDRLEPEDRPAAGVPRRRDAQKAAAVRGHAVQQPVWAQRDVLWQCADIRKRVDDSEAATVGCHSKHGAVRISEGPEQEST